jgi:hypothetical protein
MVHPGSPQFYVISGEISGEWEMERMGETGIENLRMWGCENWGKDKEKVTTPCFNYTT